MTITLSFILLVLVFCCFALAALQVAVTRVNLVALGLALWVLTLLIGSFAPVAR